MRRRSDPGQSRHRLSRYLQRLQCCSCFACSTGESLAFEVIGKGYSLQAAIRDMGLPATARRRASGHCRRTHVCGTMAHIPSHDHLQRRGEGALFNAIGVVSPAALCSLAVTRPGGGDQWTKATGQSITWSRAVRLREHHARRLLKNGAVYARSAARSAGTICSVFTPPSTYDDGADYRSVTRLGHGGQRVSAPSSSPRSRVPVFRFSPPRTAAKNGSKRARGDHLVPPLGRVVAMP